MKNFLKAYKWHVIIWIIGLIVLGNYVYKKVTSPPYLLNGILLGAEDGEDTAIELGTEFAESVGYKDTVYAVNLDTKYSYIPGDQSNAENNYKATHAIIGQVEDKRLDFVAGPTESMLDIAYNSLFAELTTTLTREERTLLEPYFLYIDGEVLEELETAFEDKKDTSNIILPDPTKPDDMREPLAVMIDISSCEKLTKIYGGSEKPLALGMISSAPNDDILRKFINYLMK